jgi:hypothetical protein
MTFDDNTSESIPFGYRRDCLVGSRPGKVGFPEKTLIDAAAGRLSGRRPFIIAGGMGASAPIIDPNYFSNRKSISGKKSQSPPLPLPGIFRSGSDHHGRYSTPIKEYFCRIINCFTG